MATIIDLTGQRFGRLEVLSRVTSSPGGTARWLCRCSCGTECPVWGSSLRSGGTQSCGCLQRERSSGKAELPIADMMGCTFGQLEVVGDAGSKNDVRRLMCRCSCGTVREFNVTTLRDSNPMTSCGCTRAGRRTDLTGKRFGRLLVMGPDDKRGKHRRWKCRCDCGNVNSVQTGNLKRTVSCGCYSRELLRSEKGHGRARKHGAAGAGGKERTPAYTTWQGMVARCTKPEQKNYRDYGGRGITVCERWLTFEGFFADMGERPPEMSLDRRDPNGNYEPGNCRWATAKEQAQTKRLSTSRVAAVLNRMRAESVDLLERAVIDRVRRELLGV